MSSTIRGSDNFDSDIIPSGRVASAWVNFNGTGTVAIRDSYNVSSITDNGTGNYTVNYSSSLGNTDYCPVFGCSLRTADAAVGLLSESRVIPRTASAITLRAFNEAGAAEDFEFVSVGILGGI